MASREENFGASRDLSPTITGATPIEALPAHTPGPWIVTSDGHYVSEASNPGGILAIVSAPMDRDGHRRVNARLIAAAPDLLEALRAAQRLCAEALPKFDWGRSSLDGNAIGLLNEVPGVIAAAIAKATSQASEGK